MKSPDGDITTPPAGAGSLPAHCQGAPGSTTQPSSVGTPIAAELADQLDGAGRTTSAVSSGLASSSSSDAWSTDRLAATLSAVPA